MLKIKNLEVKNSNFVLKNINLDLNMGHIHAIIGKNGAGKSTFLRSFFSKFNGKIKFGEYNLAVLNPKNKAKLISYLDQFSISPNISVYQTLELGRRVYCGAFITKKDRDKIDACIEQFELKEFLNSGINELSGGQKQKIMISSALLQEPKILLLDEPISHLDPKNQRSILNIIKEQTITHNLVTLIVLHDISHTLYYANSVIMLKNGELFSHKATKDISQDDLSMLFDIETKIFTHEGRQFAFFV